MTNSIRNAKLSLTEKIYAAAFVVLIAVVVVGNII